MTVSIWGGSDQLHIRHIIIVGWGSMMRVSSSKVSFIWEQIIYSWSRNKQETEYDPGSTNMRRQVMCTMYRASIWQFYIHCHTIPIKDPILSFNYYTVLVTSGPLYILKHILMHIKKSKFNWLLIKYQHSSSRFPCVSINPKHGTRVAVKLVHKIWLVL